MTARTLFAKIWDAHVVPSSAQRLPAARRPASAARSRRLARAARSDRRGSRCATRADVRHARSRHLERAGASRHLRGRHRAARGAARRRRRGRHPLLRPRRARPGHRARDGPGARARPARLTLVCGDSHTCTNGGSARWPSASARPRCAHVLATQTLRQRRPKTMRVTFDGALAPGVTRQGPDPAPDRRARRRGRRGLRDRVRRPRDPRAGDRGAAHALQPLDRAGREGRDDRARRHDVRVPRRAAVRAQGRRLWDRARRGLAELPSDDDATFDRDEWRSTRRAIAPLITWGTSPEHVDRRSTSAFPIPAVADRAGAAAWRRRSTTWASTPARRIAGTKVDWVFIGSCTNSASRICAKRPRSRAAGGSRRACAPGWCPAPSR